MLTALVLALAVSAAFTGLVLAAIFVELGLLRKECYIWGAVLLPFALSLLMFSSSFRNWWRKYLGPRS